MTPNAIKACRFLAGCPGGSSTLKQEDLESLLLDTGGFMLACGSLYDIKPKHLGAGVFSVTLEMRYKG